MADFRVDDYVGTDTQRLTSAQSAAIAAGPGSRIMLPDRTLTLLTHFTARDGMHYVGEGPDAEVFIDCPGTAAPAGNSQRGFVVIGNGTGGTLFSDFSIRARTVDYYRLIVIQGCDDVTVRDMHFGVCGQNFLEIRDCVGVDVHDILGPYGGDNSWDGISSKYKLHFINSYDCHLWNLEMGRAADDHNQSFVTFNNVQRGSVRDSLFYGTKTYCFNTHGLGSREIIVENNDFRPGGSQTYGAILLGNEAWGADYDVVVRNNTMTGGGCFIEIRMDCVVYIGDNTATSADPYLRTKLEDQTGARVCMGFHPADTVEFGW